MNFETQQFVKRYEPEVNLVNFLTNEGLNLTDAIEWVMCYADVISYREFNDLFGQREMYIYA